MTTEERIDYLESRVKLLTNALALFIKDVRASKPSLEFDCDGDVVDVCIDYDLGLLFRLENSLKD